MAEPSDSERIEAERRAFAIPRATGVLRGIDLSMLDPADSDERRPLIEAEHPELAEALERGDDETVVAGHEINPRLHLTIHEVITSQLWDNDPPEAWETARRLLAEGYERHEIFHMLGSGVALQLWRISHEGEPFEREEYLRDLAALPSTWERERSERREERAASGS